MFPMKQMVADFNQKGLEEWDQKYFQSNPVPIQSPNAGHRRQHQRVIFYPNQEHIAYQSIEQNQSNEQNQYQQMMDVHQNEQYN